MSSFSSGMSKSGTKMFQQNGEGNSNYYCC